MKNKKLAGFFLLLFGLVALLYAADNDVWVQQMDGTNLKTFILPATANGLVGFDGSSDLAVLTDVTGLTSLALPNGAAPTTNATGEIALDTTITDHQPLLQYYDGGENMTAIAIDTAQLPALDNEIVKYDAVADKFVLEADAGAGISNVVEDASPQLGGGLDVNTNEITGAIDLHSTGDLIVELGDAAGVNELSIRDSGAVEVATINSDGDISVVTLDANEFVINEAASGPTVAAGEGAIWMENAAPNLPRFRDDTSQDFYLLPRAIAIADLGDAATPSVMTSPEASNTILSNYQSSGADHVFTLPAPFTSGAIMVTVGDEFQIDLEPSAGEIFYLNGTAMAADEHIQNTADTLGDTITGACVNINGTLRWMWNSSNANWVEATP